MRRVDIAELKAQLSTHLRHVREREEVLVCDRNKPVARITPYRPEDRASRENELTARGVLQPARKRRSSASWPHRQEMFPKISPLVCGTKSAKTDDIRFRVLGCDGNPNGSVLLSTDGRLLGAALLAGFDAREI